MRRKNPGFAQLSQVWFRRNADGLRRRKMRFRRRDGSGRGAIPLIGACGVYHHLDAQYRERRQLRY